MRKTKKDAAVEEALYWRAVGYTCTESASVKVKSVHYDPATGKKIGETEEAVAVPVEKAYPPDTAAIKYWLEKRCPARWGEAAKTDQEIRVVFDNAECRMQNAEMGDGLFGQ